MGKELLIPDYIFESSWEVCNKVGGIYTVLSTRAKTLQDKNKDHIIFIGPDCWGDKQSPYFKENTNLFADWKQKALEDIHFAQKTFLIAIQVLWNCDSSFITKLASQVVFDP